ncbi:Sugar-specific transcriptional regulator TrmB [Acetitomaculum ruminis DSM 5522]|uniref:Sugar-specific transcriptional regulator TrmB n=1 Tax=Acetitomaculum ruminis DSM 5522 TaxID=1120918 RepID=A0A1I0XTR1_9FIRM|nr:TrmB family transcriptional regulator [Acetitomaculum ruminis]SFB03363.1 Sugar-specific transcriptional regulator TrmB [Acetitomaculum ruminis DSM 5522]
MNTEILISKLTAFSLTRQEAAIYITLCKNDCLTGYEVAKQTGISRSNAYSSLKSLVDKGAAFIIEGDSKKYTIVPIDEFCNNKIRNLYEDRDFLINNLPKKRSFEEGYVTINGDENIKNKIHTMMEQTKLRLYISMNSDLLDCFRDDLIKAVKRNIKISILSEKDFDIEGVITYITNDKKNQIGVITDSKRVITGDYGFGKESSALYSEHKNFVTLFKDYMANEIKLVKKDY